MQKVYISQHKKGILWNLKMLEENQIISMGKIIDILKTIINSNQQTNLP